MARVKPSTQNQGDRCGRRLDDGTRCVLAKGHNMGNADIPENHRGYVYFSVGGLEFRRVSSGVIAAKGGNEAHGDIVWLDEAATRRLIEWLKWSIRATTLPPHATPVSDRVCGQ